MSLATMSRNLFRVLLSLGLSVAGAIATHLWFSMEQKKFARNYDSDETPLAIVKETRDQVDRKQRERLIWHLVRPSETLFSGEQIRTSDMGTTQIEFVDNGTLIDVEPGSLITIEKSAGGAEIDLISGDLLVTHEDEKTEATIQIKSEGKKIERAGKNTVISKKAGKAAEVSSLDSGAQNRAVAVDEIPVVSPGLAAVSYLDFSKNDPVQVRLSDEIPVTVDVRVEAGPYPHKLKKFDKVILKEKSIELDLPAGLHYWRVVYVDRDTGKVLRKSKISKLRIFAQRSPLQLFPEDDKLANLSEDQMKLRFEWANPGQLRNLVLEVAKDSTLKTDRQIHRVGTKMWKSVPLDQGEYYWRVTGYYGDGKPLSSRVRKVLVNKVLAKRAVESKTQASVGTNSSGGDQGQDLSSFSPTAADLASSSAEENGTLAESPTPVPEPTLPPAPEAPAFSPAVRDGLTASRSGDAKIQWSAMDRANQYFVELVNDKNVVAKTYQSPVPEIELKGLKPGQFRVRVTAIDEHGQKSQASQELRIEVPGVSNAKPPKLKRMSVE